MQGEGIVSPSEAWRPAGWADMKGHWVGGRIFASLCASSSFGEGKPEGERLVQSQMAS